MSTTPKNTPTPMRPYVFNAYYAWMIDNAFTPLIEVNTRVQGVIVPESHRSTNPLILNIALYATHNFSADDSSISFSARFNGVSHDLYLPMASITAIICRDTDRYFAFDPEEYAAEQTISDAEFATGTPEQSIRDGLKQSEKKPQFAPELIMDTVDENVDKPQKSRRKKTTATASTTATKPQFTLLD